MGLDVSGEVHVKLYSGGGALVLEQKAAISPFEPAVLDVSRLNGGTYTVVINHDGREIKQNIIKL
jgi:hypothetical protein